MNYRHYSAAIGVLLVLVSINAEQARACSPPAGFVDSPRPVEAQQDALVSHTEVIEIARDRETVMRAANRPLEEQINGSDDLPGIRGSYRLTEAEFGPVGSRRLNCLTDGSTLEEEVLRNENGHFRYIVWNYSSKAARAVSYGVGEFVYEPLSPTRTRVSWTYAFQLKRDRMPGYLGAFGRYLFRTFFLERDYAALMRSVLQSMKEAAESSPTTQQPVHISGLSTTGRSDSE